MSQHMTRRHQRVKPPVIRILESRRDFPKVVPLDAGCKSVGTITLK